MARLFTGLQPSGALHIGNYFGSLKPFLDLSKDPKFDHVFLMIADYHALTSLKNQEELKNNILSIAGDYIAAGIDTDKVHIFQQSEVPEHTELAWIFNCQINMSLLELGHAYKDKVAKGIPASVGLFSYPTLMAADILLYDATNVPVGEDQRQHIEYTREIAAKFNINYMPKRGSEEFFNENVQPEIIDEAMMFNEKVEGNIYAGTSIVPGVDGAKMSKSYQNTIPLFGSDEEIRKAVMAIKTGSEPVGSPLNPDDIVLKIYKLYDEAGAEALKARYLAGSVGYKEAKEMLAKTIIESTHDMRVKRRDITKEQILEVLKKGRTTARKFASAKMEKVRRRIGVELN